MPKLEVEECDLQALRDQIETMKLDISILEDTLEVAEHISDGSTIPFYSKTALQRSKDGLRTVVSNLGRMISDIKDKAIAASG